MGTPTGSLITAMTLLAAMLMTSIFSARSIGNELLLLPAMLGFAGFSAGTAGVHVVRLTWLSRKPDRSRYWVGWILIGLSLVLFSWQNGVARGITLGACVLTAIAYAFVLFGMELREGGRSRAAADRPEPRRDVSARQGSRWRSAGRVLVAVFLPMIVAHAVSLAETAYSPGFASDRLVTSACLVPLVWGAALVWVVFEKRLWRPTVGLMAVAAFAIAAVLLPTQL